VKMLEASLQNFTDPPADFLKIINILNNIKLF